MAKFAIVMPVGPGGGKEALDTLDSVSAFCSEPHHSVILDDCTTDGTCERVGGHSEASKVLRNPIRMGLPRLVHTLCSGFQHVLQETSAEIILRLDMDALLIKPGVLSDAAAYSDAHADVGIYGAYEVGCDGQPRDYSMHKELMDRETHWVRRWKGRTPSFWGMLRRAEARGYRRGDNVFGGAYFVTRRCLKAIEELGGLNPPYRWRSGMAEDVYFSMAACAAGFGMGHFAYPDGPLWLEWRGLPFPAEELAASPAKVIHSVDKGRNTGASENGGVTAREYFRGLRRAEILPAGGARAHEAGKS